MRWGVAWYVVCVAVAMLARGAAAQDAEEDDDDPPAVTAKPSFWASLLEPHEPSRPPFDFLTGGMPDRMLYLSGVEMQRWSLAAYAGAQWAPARIDRDGFILRMVLSDSVNRFTTPTHCYDTQILRGTLMPGYKLSHDKFELQVLAGVGTEIDAELTDRSAAAWRLKLGAQITADLWWEPSRAWMLQASFSATTIDNGFNSRAAAG